MYEFFQIKKQTRDLFFNLSNNFIVNNLLFGPLKLQEYRYKLQPAVSICSSQVMAICINLLLQQLLILHYFMVFCVLFVNLFYTKYILRKSLD
jgi:hypothetical protein